MKKKNYYIDKKNFYEEIKNYKNTKIINDSLANMFTILVKKISHKFSFRGYSEAELDDMKSEAVISCMNALDSFNIRNKKKNPFSYFTQVVMNSYRYYLKQMYRHENFKEEMIEEYYKSIGKQFEGTRKRVCEDLKKENEEIFIED